MARKKRELTGKTLNNLWDVGVKHALYREDGNWYHKLTEFPGALFDANGFVIFNTEKEFLDCPYLQRKQDIHVPQGISSIPSYVRVTDGNRLQAFSQELKERAKGYYASSPKVPFVVASAFDLPEHQEVERILAHISRIIRDTKISRYVKAIHNYQCQVCGFLIDMGNGKLYAESHHIKPLGSKYNGPDVVENILCVCPTCHVLLDYGVIRIIKDRLREIQGHVVGEEYVQFHNTNIFNHGAS